jgi:RNA polymerase sigma-70 factor (ECF subfamily)
MRFDPDSSASGSAGAADAIPQRDSATHASIFLKLKHSDPAPRELAWREFYHRYAPVISGYTRRKGASAQQADEVVQDVIGGFFAASPRFVYDPSRGRFRAYLKTCAAHALAKIRLSLSPPQDGPVEEVQIADQRDEQLWDRLWQQQVLRRALEIVRDHYTRKGKLETFLAFEQNVILGRPAPDVAQELGLNVNSVHAAKVRVTEKLREARAALEDEEG